jgi:hypothetical membrane protein
MRRRSLKWTRGLGIAGMSGAASVVLTDVIGILARPGYNPISQSVSELAVGPTGWIQDLGMFLGAVGALACAAGLYLVLDEGWYLKMGEFLLFVAGLGLLLAAVFKTDLVPPKTVGGIIHDIASLVSGIAFVPVCFLISPALRRRRALFAYTIAAGLLGAGLEIGTGRFPEHWVLFGLHERLFLGNAVAWVWVVSWMVLLRYPQSRTPPA